MRQKLIVILSAKTLPNIYSTFKVMGGHDFLFLYDVTKFNSVLPQVDRKAKGVLLHDRHCTVIYVAIVNWAD